MSNYIIKSSFSIFEEGNLENSIDVCDSASMTQVEAESIDDVEDKFLNLDREVIRRAMAEHLENQSKKNAKNTRKKMVE